MQGKYKTFKAANISWNDQSSKVLFSTFKGTHPANQNFPMGKRGAPKEREDGFSGGLLPIALKIGDEGGEENNRKLHLDQDEII